MIKNKFRTNEEIKADKVRVIDETGEDLGVMSAKDGLRIAESKGLDIIEIAPQVNPPVVRIQDFDKFRYEQEKKEKKKRQQQKGGDIKRIRITPRIAKNDLDLKARRTIEFLEEGNRVEIQIFLKGREKANKDFAKNKLEEFLQSLEADFKRASEPRYTGRGFQIQIIKK